MSYTILGQNLHETADGAKRYFAHDHGVKNFKCEEAIARDLGLKPTWQGMLSTGYCVCVDVRESPFSNSLNEFVTNCASRCLPVQLWVAVPSGPAASTFNSELKQAREVGVGVVQISDDGSCHEFHRPVPLSLFGLRKTELQTVPKGQREDVKAAESTFLDGSPGQGCQAICQALESLTRAFAEHTYSLGFWKYPAGSKPLLPRFFTTDSWANMLEEMEKHIDVQVTKAKVGSFSKQAIVRVRGYTDWRNEVSHKPKTFKQRQARDAKLRTMFESTRDILVEWYAIAKPFKLVR